MKQFVPPIVAELGRRFLGPAHSERPSGASINGSEQTASWYDASFAKNAEWKKHYTSSRYHFLWAVLVDRLLRYECRAILDIGCGPGQLACMLRDYAIDEYCGIDFSVLRVEHARTICPEFNFFVEDAFSSDKVVSLSYDAVLMTEVLEHVEQDRELISRIRGGARVLATVPNFPYVSHVRHFADEGEVMERYAPLLTTPTVTKFIGNSNGKAYFLLDGIRAE